MFASMIKGRINRSGLYRGSMLLFAICFIAFAGSLIVQPEARAETNVSSAKKFTVPMIPFIQNYMHGLVDNHYAPKGNFNIPAVWLYSPDGKMLAQATTQAELDSIIGRFPSAERAPPLTDMPELSVFQGILAKTAGVPASSLVAGDSSQWTVVLLSTDVSSCEQCAGFEKSVANMEVAHPKQLHAINVLLAH